MNILGWPLWSSMLEAQLGCLKQIRYVTWMIQVSGLVASECRINHVPLAYDVTRIFIYRILVMGHGRVISFGHSEHVTAKVVLTFTDICNRLAKHFANIFNNDWVFWMVDATEQPQLMYGRRSYENFASRNWTSEDCLCWHHCLVV